MSISLTPQTGRDIVPFMPQNQPKAEQPSDTPPETTNPEVKAQDTGQDDQVAAQASKTGPNGEPVDNSMIQEASEVDEPSEMPESELPPEVSPGDMGVGRAQLMLALGMDATHPFDAEVEARVREICPDYTGTVTKEMWRKIIRSDYLVSGSKE